MKPLLQVSVLLTVVLLGAGSAMAAGPRLTVSTLTASGNDGNVPANANDGSLDTRWSALGDGSWLQADLGADKTIGTITIAWHRGDTRHADFQVQVSKSATPTTWTTVVSRRLASGTTVQPETYDFTDASARYIRVTGYGNELNEWNSITELAAYGPEITVLPVSATSASGDDGNVPANAVDGNMATRWSDQGSGVWLQLDLGTDKSIGFVTIAWHDGNVRHADFQVQVAKAATPTTWTTVVSRRLASGNTLQPENYNFTDANARYIRVTGYGNEVNDWTSIAEIAAFGPDGGSGSGGSGGGGTGGGGGDSAGCTNPGDVINLTNWELTLPTGDSENPDDIYQPALRTFKVDPWFKPTSSCDGVLFRAPVNGVTTSGSANPRSELREMKNNGADKANWSSTSGTHTLIVSEAFVHLPNTRPYVVGAQIHDSADDVQVFRLEGSSLWLTNGDTAHYKLITSNYVLGTRFEAKFVVSGGQIKAYYNGVLQSTLSKSFSGAYFKAGAYTQANCTNSSPCSSSNYGETIIYSLSISHQ